MFWSDLGTAVGYEAIGIIDSSLPTVAVFAKHDESKAESKDESKAESETKAGDTEAKSPLSVQAVEKECPPVGTVSSPDDYDKGVLFYMKDDRIVGILLWNVFNRISIARKILTSEEHFKDLNEVAKLFDIFDQQDKQN